MPIIALSDLSDERLAPFVRLTDHQLKDGEDRRRGLMVAESRIVLELALREQMAPQALLLDERHLRRMVQVLSTVPEEVPIFVAPRDVLSEVVGYNVTRGYYGAFRRPDPRTVGDAFRGTRLIAVLDGLVDPTNVGALFRSAAALGADAVLLSPTCADPLCRRSLRVSMGTVLQVPWARFGADLPWPHEALGRLRSEGFHVAAMALAEGATPLDDPTLSAHERIALVFGSEGWGLPDATVAACDEAVVIPMAARVDSLNVAASAAVALWELRRN